MDTLLQLTAALGERYTIERELGRGGMATVYLARDVKHDRLVALKLLDPELGAVLGGERFLSEIRVTANLQHPNLLPLFDSGEAGGLLYYVMPYVDGESLRAALEREKQLPVDESIRIAVAIASALDYAHKHGVVHRDLKPENILLQSRQPIVADFGIALAVSKAGGARITQTGLSLGTPQYMSPEQATGDRVIDGRTDIYSLAAMLYEMLTGDPPHMGSTAQAVIAKVLTEKPPRVRISRESVPEHVEAAIERALAKLPADRFATAHEFAEALVGRGDFRATTGDSGSRRATPYRTRGDRVRTALPWTVALAIAIGLGLWGSLRPREAVHSTTRFALTLPKEDRSAQGLAISRDGSTIVYAGNTLVVRSLSELEGRPLPGTTRGFTPFFSPDGKWIAFNAVGTLKKVAVSGGAPVLILDSVPTVTGGAWGPNDLIAFTGATHAIMTVSANGGAWRPLTQLAPGEVSHIFPEFLPNGNGILFTIFRGAYQTSEIAVATLDGRITRLGLKGLGARYFDGNLVIAHSDGSLAIASFDAKQRVVGRERALDPRVDVTNFGGTNYALSSNGTLVYAPYKELPTQPVLVNRAGAVRALRMEPRAYQRPRFSPDGRRIAFDTRAAVDGEIWIYDIASETPQRFAAGEDVHQPEWQPHGNGLLYIARTDTTLEDMMIVPLDGSADAQRLLRARGDQYDASWTPDGQSVVYIDDDPLQGIWRMRLADRKPIAWLSGAGASTFGPRVSPDGRWLAYTSNRSGIDEVYVRAFPTAAGAVQISSGSGIEPVWSRDGRTLFYRQDDKLMEAALVTTPVLSVTSRREVFTQRFLGDGNHTYYDVSPDGKSFAFLKDNEALAQLVVVLNWDADLRPRTAKP